MRAVLMGGKPNYHIWYKNGESGSIWLAGPPLHAEVTPAPPGCLACWRRYQLLSLLVPHVVIAWREDTRRPLLSASRHVSSRGECGPGVGRGGGGSAWRRGHTTFVTLQLLWNVCLSFRWWTDVATEKKNSGSFRKKKTVWLNSWIVVFHPWPWKVLYRYIWSCLHFSIFYL